MNDDFPQHRVLRVLRRHIHEAMVRELKAAHGGDNRAMAIYDAQRRVLIQVGRQLGFTEEAMKVTLGVSG